LSFRKICLISNDNDFFQGILLVLFELLKLIALVII